MKRERRFGSMMMADYKSSGRSSSAAILRWGIGFFVGLALFPALGLADFGQVIQVKGGTVQRINQSRRINSMLALDNMVYEKDILRGDGQAQAILKTGWGTWYLGKNIELQIIPNERTLLEITHGQCKILSTSSLHNALPVRLGNLEIQFMHKFALLEEGEGAFKGGWLISGLALLTLKMPDQSRQRFELSSEDWLIFYHLALNKLTAYRLKRPKFLQKDNINSFFRDYREVYANEVLEEIPFAAVTPTPVPAKKIIRSADELRLSEGQEQKVNLTGDPDLFLENYYQTQLRQQTQTPQATTTGRKNVSQKRGKSSNVSRGR